MENNFACGGGGGGGELELVGAFVTYTIIEILRFACEPYTITSLGRLLYPIPIFCTVILLFRTSE